MRGSALRPPPPDIFEYLRYNKDSGTFTWIQTKAKSRIGCVAGNFDSYGYREISFRSVIYKVSSLVWLAETGEWPTFILDHRDLTKSNNLFTNLRPATRSQNRANTPKQRRPASSKYKGVSRARGKWQSGIGVNGRSVSLGRFDSEEDAAAAYAEAARRVYGEYARVK